MTDESYEAEITIRNANSKMIECLRYLSRQQWEQEAHQKVEL